MLRCVVKRCLAREALHENIAHPWTLGELAQTVRLSPQQLTRVFAEAFGKTPIAYLTMLRVQEMARLLRETDLPVAAAGRRVGWSSRSRATEAFIEHIGLSPSRYRAMRPVGGERPLGSSRVREIITSSGVRPDIADSRPTRAAALVVQWFHVRCLRVPDGQLIDSAVR